MDLLDPNRGGTKWRTVWLMPCLRRSLCISFLRRKEIRVAPTEKKRSSCTPYANGGYEDEERSSRDGIGKGSLETDCLAVLSLIPP